MRNYVEYSDVREAINECLKAETGPGWFNDLLRATKAAEIRAMLENAASRK